MAQCESNEVVDLHEFPFFHSYISDVESADIASNSESHISFNMFGTCSLRNVRRIMRQSRRLKPLRVHLLKSVLDLCKAADLEPFVYGGTALSVFREDGKFISHDTDIDLGILEFDSNGNSSYTKLIHCCLKNGISVFGVENMDESLLISVNSDLYVDFSASICRRFWLKAQKFNMSETIEEIPYNGCDCKRIKFFFITNGLLKACELYHLNSKIVSHIQSDPSLVHVDLFTLSTYPDSSDDIKPLLVNWNLPGIYDCKKKLFPYNSFFPLIPCTFEGVNLLAPHDLKTYLTIEYGYLGRDAVYDRKKQLCKIKRIFSSGRLTRLRDLLKDRNLQGYILPTEDEHFNEYVGNADRRCAFISGFTGSSCSIVITLDQAALWTDGRYQLQASNELDENWSLFRNDLTEAPTRAQWIVSSTSPGSSIGYDGRQIPYTGIETLQKELAGVEAELGILPNCNGIKNPLSRQLVNIPNTNLIDLVWESMSELQIENVSRPIRSSNPLLFIPVSFSGSSWQQKIDRVRNMMKAKGAELLVLSALDEIAWLFNLRGNDILYNPVFYAYAIVSLNKIDLFLNPKTVDQTPRLDDYLSDKQYLVKIHPYSEFFNHLETVVHNSPEKHLSLQPSRVWFDISASYAIVTKIPENRRLFHISPVAEMKSIKSLSELNGIREIHITDSLVLCDFLAWLEDEANQINNNSCCKQSHDYKPIKPNTENGAGLPVITPPLVLTEASTAQYLDELRSQAKDFFSLSFSTISCADANGAIIHYHPVEGQSAPITNTSIYLVDSGGQYLTGTTDVTRTIHLGEPTLEQKNCYTTVLKAHIALAMQIFPSNTPGSRLDIISRRIMWQFHGNYAHGTGHGVGAFLNVHEGPIGLSGSRINAYSRLGIVEPGLQENMVVTIEPGYYWSDHFGIRLENVVFVVPVETKDLHSSDRNNYTAETSTGHRSFQFSPDINNTKWLSFEPVTLVPFQRKFINSGMLTTDELNWLDNYHKTVRQVLCSRIYQEVNIQLSINNGNDDHEIMLSNMSMLSSSRQRCLRWILNQTESFL